MDQQDVNYVYQIDSSRTMNRSSNNSLHICAPIFQPAHSAQFNLSSSILNTPSRQHSNTSVVDIPSSHYLPCKQDHTVKELLPWRWKNRPWTSSLELLSLIDSGVSHVPSGGAAGRKLIEIHLRSIPFHTFFYLFFNNTPPTHSNSNNNNPLLFLN